MNSIVINGGHHLDGQISIQGSKNSVLPIMAASILNGGLTIIGNCPRITDVLHMAELLQMVGCVVSFYKNILVIDSRDASVTEINSEFANKIRASIIFAGPLLGRFQNAQISMPGGCNIGPRPIDLHVSAFEKMNIDCTQTDEFVRFTAGKGHVTGAQIHLKYPSVGATENILLAAVRAQGATDIYNAAIEPEICELCEFLKLMGADISGEGTTHISINGVSELNDVVYSINPDRIVAGTYICAAISAGGDITLNNCTLKETKGYLDILYGMGAKIHETENGLNIVANKRQTAVNYIRTSPFPGFPTDMQPIVMAVLCRAMGNSVIEEKIFNNRLGLAKELRKMGACIVVDGSKAQITGVSLMHGAKVEASDLRAGAALVVAALGVEGESVINNAFYIERGYENICADLNILGARTEHRKF